MKKIFWCMVVALSLMFLMSTTTFAISGEGTEESPYQITNSDELLIVSDFPTMHFKLMADVEISTSLGEFCGVFDGNNYRINTDADTVFGTNNGTIKNLRVYEQLVETNSEMGIIENCTSSYMIADINKGIIRNSHTLSANKDRIIFGSYNGTTVTVYMGGLTCENYGTIEKCSFVCDEYNIQTEENCLATLYYGGISAKNSGIISECYANANVSLTDNGYGGFYYEKVGGIVGVNSGSIVNSYSLGTHSKRAWSYDVSKWEDCTIDGGGICYGGYVVNCYTTCTFDVNRGVSNYHEVGGTVENSFYLSNFPGTDGTDHGTPASSVSMKMKELYVNWDFNTVWAMDSEINDGYPYLRWQYPEDVEEPETPVVPDEHTPTVKVVSVKGKSGETVSVPLYIENNTGIAGMQLSLTYDDRLTLTGMVRSTGEDDSALESLNFTVPGDLTATTLTLPWYGIDADSTNGKILVLTFTIPETAEDDTVYNIAISYEQGGIYDNDLNDVDFEMVNGSITVKNCTIGDINDDGLINTKDITLLSRGIAGGYGVTLTESADVNGDGLTNTKDITILSRYIAGGYGVTLGN